MTTLSGLHRAARARLATAGVVEAALDARLLVEALTGTTRADALARPEAPVPADAAGRVHAALARRAAGEPVHRILGRREFYGLPLALSPDTLEPRPDTETLVDLALSLLPDRSAPLSILDLGTGTGAVGLALLSVLRSARAVLTDIVPGALSTAAANAAALGLAERVETCVSDWFASVEGRFDLIVSNPPYIPEADIAGLAVEVVRHDPWRALDGGPDGLDAYRAIASGAADFLAPGGFVAVEIGAGQGDDVRAVFSRAGFAPRASAGDLSGRERSLAFAP